MPEHYEQTTAAPNEHRHTRWPIVGTAVSPERRAYLIARCERDGHDLYQSSPSQASCDRCGLVFNLVEPS